MIRNAIIRDQYDAVLLDLDGVITDTANLHAAGGDSLVAPTARVRAGQLAQAVVGAGAVVEGAVTRGVVWPGGYVGADEHLTDAIRAGCDLTVLALPRSPQA